MRSFEYRRIERPGDLSGDSVGALASFIAGGTTLLDLMKLDVMRPTQVLDINPLARFGDFGQIVVEERGAQLGSLVRMSEAAEHPYCALPIQSSCKRSILPPASSSGIWRA
jgi:xanthine dehydrogenase YagS FAD-binding subunit